MNDILKIKIRSLRNTIEYLAEEINSDGVSVQDKETLRLTLAFLNRKLETLNNMEVK